MGGGSSVAYGLVSRPVTDLPMRVQINFQLLAPRARKVLRSTVRSTALCNAPKPASQ
jgi:hypothetical protein